jgi:DNA modification methylase
MKKVAMSCFHFCDVFTGLQRLEDNTIDLIYSDPPFGTTQNTWDEKLDWYALFQQFYRVLKVHGMIVLHASVPFNYHLIQNKTPSHSWYWRKEGPSPALYANHQPMRDTEEVLVWKNKYATYFRQQHGTSTTSYRKGKTKGSYYKEVKCAGDNVVTGKTRTHSLTMSRCVTGFATRPDELVKLMIASYSVDHPSTVLLDPFCYNQLTYLCRGQRRWIGIDKHFFFSAVCF